MFHKLPLNQYLPSSLSFLSLPSRFCLSFFSFLLSLTFVSLFFVHLAFATHTTSLPNLSIFLDLYTKSAIAQQKEDTAQVIRIGYKENYAVVKNPFVEGHEGYGYEYINEILKHTNGKYKAEYIQVNWSDGLKMLEDGHLDFLAGCNYTEERAEKFLFVSEIFCQDTLVLISLNQDPIKDIHDLNDTRIFVQKDDAMLPVFYKFLEDNAIIAEVTEGDFGSIRKTERTGMYDYVLSGSVQMDENLNVVVNLGTHPTYLMTTKDKQNLVDVFDTATQELQKQDYLFQERLHLKYFDNNRSRFAYISPEELDLIREDNPYLIGIRDLDSSYAYKTANGQMQGVFLDIMQSIQALSGIEYTIIEINSSTTKDELEAIDFAFISKQDEAKYNLPKSQPMTKLPYVIVQGKNAHNEGKKIVGTLDYYNLSLEDIHYFIESDVLKEYPSAHALIQAFNAGEIHNMVITAKAFAKEYPYLTDKELIITNINFWYTPTISFSPFFPAEKIQILNKLISNVNSYAIEDSVAKHLAIITTKNEMYYIMKYRYEIALSFLCLVFLLYLARKRMHKQKEKELQILSDYNSTTGLFSIKRFREEVTAVLENDQETDYSIISTDVDNFRYINEIYGYDIGSDVLKEIALHFQESLTDSLPLGANAGNFLIMLKTAKLMKKDLELYGRDSLDKRLEKYLGKSHTLSFSVGIYHIIDRTHDAMHILECANIARNKAKKTFGTSFEVYTEDIKNEYVEKAEVLTSVSYAFENKEFKLVYQPKFDIKNMEIVGAEALIRWYKDDKIVPPDKFIPVIESNHLIDQLDYYVMDAVCHFIKANQDIDMPKLSINLSGHTITREDVVLELIDIAQRHDVAPSRLDLEITESALVDNFNIALDNINLLRKVGFTISMDDFGAGISSLNRLHHIPIDILKIDRGFIVDALENPRGASIIRNIINLAREINVETVAEGIETEEQLEFLRHLACDVGQGYFFSRPIPESDFLQLLKKTNITK